MPGLSQCDAVERGIEYLVWVFVGYVVLWCSSMSTPCFASSVHEHRRHIDGSLPAQAMRWE